MGCHCDAQRFNTIIFLAEDERVPLALKEKATSFLLKELYNGTNYEYDYYGNKITEASKRICLQLQKEEEYLATLDRILSKKNLSGYDKRIYTAEKISILSKKFLLYRQLYIVSILPPK